VSNREKTMEQWDYYRKLIADGHTSSLPRDWFESILDGRDELSAALSDLLEYAQLASQEIPDPGTGLLCAIHNAKQIINETQ
jgi:hypothetical protein